MATARAPRRTPVPQPAFVLQRHDWSESSLIVELFTRGLGRVVTVARGAKRPTSNYRALLLPFQPVAVLLGAPPKADAGDEGDRELLPLRSAEWAGDWAAERVLRGTGGWAVVRGPALFSAFYLNAAEKAKYAGLGSTPMPGFGTCRIQQAMIQPHKGYATFASYYCEKTGGSETENATFAASIGKQVETCLPNSYFVEGNDGGQSIKTREYALSISGYPRVRVVHHKDGVTIHLDAK